MVLYNLFCSSVLDEDILIFYEPEINLHPEWQVKLAELLVQLRNEFNLTLLINTHSPFFSAAIDIYSYKYKISDKCNYYMSFNDKINNIEYSYLKKIEIVDDIYDSLSEPFEKLYAERSKIIDG